MMHFCKPTSLKTGTLYYLYFIGNSFLISYHLGCYNFFLTYIILLKSLMKITLKYHLPKLCLWQRWQKKLLLYTMSSKSTFIDVINCLYIHMSLPLLVLASRRGLHEAIWTSGRNTTKYPGRWVQEWQVQQNVDNWK